MQADHAVQRQLLDLAKVDAELSRIAYRRRNLPELAESDDVEKRLRERRDALVAVQTSMSDLDREMAKQEREVDSVRSRAERNRTLMDSGSVSAKQLPDLEHELNTLSRRQSALEDDLLELMEQREALELDVQRTGAEVDTIEQELAEVQARRDETLTNLDTTQARREADREQLVARLPEDLLALYERVRERKGIGAALLRARRCGACHLELDRSAISQIKGMSEDEVVQCENCGAILVRTLESGL